jgi:ADP-heptose:LPS heptosyltransferase
MLINKNHKKGRGILFFQYDTALGSVMNATPVFEVLRRERPNAFIGVVAGPLAYEVLKLNPYIDKIYKSPCIHSATFRALLFILIRMPLLSYYYHYGVSDSFNRRAIITLAQFLSGVRKKTGYSNKPWLMAHTIQVSKLHEERIRHSVIEDNLKVLEVFDIQSKSVEPSMFFKKSKSFWTLNEKKARVVIASRCGDINHPKSWYSERFIAVAEYLSLQYSAYFAFVGTDSDHSAIEDIRSKANIPSMNLAGKTSVSELAQVLCESDILLTIDTGVVHLARGVGLPMLVLASAWHDPKPWLSVGVPTVKVIQKLDVPCALCWKNHCDTRECMQEISVDEVCSSLDSLLDEYPPSTLARKQRMTRCVQH